MVARIPSETATGYAKWSAVKLDQIRLHLWHKTYGPRRLLILRAKMIKSFLWLSGFGKAPAAVAQAASSKGIPCIALAGSLDKSAFQLYEIGIQAVFSLCPGPVSLNEALENAAEYLADTTEQVIRCFRLAGAHKFVR